MSHFDHHAESSRFGTWLRSDTRLAPFAAQLSAAMEHGWQRIEAHGDFARWQAGLEALPAELPSSSELKQDTVRIGNFGDTQMGSAAVQDALMQLHPWRKGPFELFGVHIDTEWRSDWKWRRVAPHIAPHIAPLGGRTVLDVGCGSGYHCWRMLGDGAKAVLGIDPTPLFAMQFACCKRYLPEALAFYLPVGIDDMPEHMGAFDTVFSMGILYHRRSPIDHLLQLKSLLRPGGELVLETLIVEGDAERCLLPEGRYAKMRNVWFIPSVAMLKLWLARSGFKNIRCVDVTPTRTDEQRTTDWMQFESLTDFLDPEDSGRTIEGYPAPVRAVLIAEA
jgi:tRNA (mo5U34)-methyltransferase